MSKILIPIGGSRNDPFALEHVIQRFRQNSALELHLLNVQAPFSSDISHFSSRKSRGDFHRERAEAALAPARALLDGQSIPYAVHILTGEPAEVITGLARRLHCSEIVMATGRKNALTRWIENSVTDKVLALTTVPVEVIAGEPMSGWERFGIPAAIAAGLSMVVALAD